MSSAKKSSSPVQRGDKDTNAASVAVFVGGRSLSPVVQYGILAKGYASSIITALGGSVLPQGPPLISGTMLDAVGLSPYRSILFAMPAIAMLKQSIHVTNIMQERLTTSFAVQVGLFNLTVDTVNSLLFLCSQTSASNNGEHFPQTPLLIGSVLFAAGIAIELGSEYQRHFFKKDAANKGKVYEHGLFSLSRHVNYFGYNLWRLGYAMAAGGYIWAGVTGAFFAATFIGSSIPELQSYLEQKYGEQYEHYERAVPYKFIPYIY